VAEDDPGTSLRLNGGQVFELPLDAVFRALRAAAPAAAAVDDVDRKYCAKA